MIVSPPDALVGAIALEYVLLRFKPELEDDPDFHGAFHVLSGFSAEQLAGFIQASINAGDRAARLTIQFPEFELRPYGVSSQYITTDSSVNVRNRERDGTVTLTAEVEADAGASLADSDRTDASDLKDKAIAHIWVDFVARNVGINVLPEDLKKFEAMQKGLFETGRCPTSKAGEFLSAVLTNFKSGEPLNRAAGKALPIIGLPLFEDCFSSLNESKMVQPSQWAGKFKSHYSLECYLDKRGLAQEMLDPDTLRKNLAELRSEEQHPPIPEQLLNAFEEYIESEGSRNSATEQLLFTFDWSFTKHCLATTVKERDPSILFHSDATQAVGKITVDLATDLSDVDLLSFSAHKFHGPKGVGALFIRDRNTISPILHGGGQQNGIRSGTENPAGIVGMATALAKIKSDLEWTSKIAELRDHLDSRIRAIHPSAFILGSAAERLPTTTFVCLPDIDGDDLVDRMAAKNIAISSGSACSFGSTKPSHVALAHGLSYEHAKSCVRLSLSMETTNEEVGLFLRAFEELLDPTRQRMEIG